MGQPPPHRVQSTNGTMAALGKRHSVYNGSLSFPFARQAVLLQRRISSRAEQLESSSSHRSSFNSHFRCALGLE